jgi:hypothetical protein
MKVQPVANPIQHSDLFKFGQHLGSASSPSSFDPIYTPIIAKNGSASQFHDNQDSPLYYIDEDEDEDYYEITCKKKRSRLRKLYLALIKLGYLRSALKKTVKRQPRNA